MSANEQPGPGGFRHRGKTNLLRGRVRDSTLIRHPTGRLSYRYWIDRQEGIGFRCSMLCEVGEPYQKPFVERLRELVAMGYRYISRDIESPPYVCEYLLPPGVEPLAGDRSADWNLSRGTDEQKTVE